MTQFLLFRKIFFSEIGQFFRAIGFLSFSFLSDQDMNTKFIMALTCLLVANITPNIWKNYMNTTLPHCKYFQCKRYMFTKQCSMLTIVWVIFATNKCCIHKSLLWLKTKHTVEIRVLNQRKIQQASKFSEPIYYLLLCAY